MVVQVTSSYGSIVSSYTDTPLGHSSTDGHLGRFLSWSCRFTLRTLVGKGSCGRTLFRLFSGHLRFHERWNCPAT